MIVAKMAGLNLFKNMDKLDSYVFSKYRIFVLFFYIGLFFVPPFFILKIQKLNVFQL